MYALSTTVIRLIFTLHFTVDVKSNDPPIKQNIIMTGEQPISFFTVSQDVWVFVGNLNLKVDNILVYSRRLRHSCCEIEEVKISDECIT